MAQAKATKSFLGAAGEAQSPDGIVRPGDTFDVDDDRRRDLIRSGLIEADDAARQDAGAPAAVNTETRLFGDPEEKRAQDARNKEALAGANKAVSGNRVPERAARPAAAPVAPAKS